MTSEEIRAAVEAEFGDNPHMARKVALYISHRYSGRKLKDIGKCFGIGESAVSQNSLRFNPILLKDKKLRKRIDKINRTVGMSDV